MRDPGKGVPPRRLAGANYLRVLRELDTTAVLVCLLFLARSAAALESGALLGSVLARSVGSSSLVGSRR